MNLSELMAQAAVPGLALVPAADGTSDASIGDIALDSRQCAPGTLFAALPGSQVDGARFIPAAIAAGASAVLVGPGVDTGALSVPALVHPDPGFALSQLTAAFYQPFPANLVAVTGTNGKTSVVNFLRQMWQSSGLSAASVGTLGVLPRGLVEIPELTSPDSVSVGRALSGLNARGISHVALEASSHGLDQHRLHGLRFAAAGFTNFTQDHLDYHGTMQAYLHAKTRLFTQLNQGPAVINLDHVPEALLATLRALDDQQILSVARSDGPNAGQADVTFDATPNARGLSLHLFLPGGGYSGQLQMVGKYQAENVAMAAGLALASGLHSDAIVEAVASLKPAPGRMDWATSHPGGGPVLVDYAHTPDALSAAIDATRPHVRGRLIVVFGAGGDRDPAKRPLMGQAVAEGADVAIVTDDNPRTEDPASIRAAIMAAVPQALEIGDRRAAIHHALNLMEPGDGVLIAGKGHEQGQKIRDQVLPFDDFTVAQQEAAQVF